jgi:lanosterol synthase
MPWQSAKTLDIPASGEKPFTDYERWRLGANDGGRHIWNYLTEEEAKEAPPQPLVDKFWLGLPLVRTVYSHFVECSI